MSTVLSGLKIAVLGGDARELILIAELVKMGTTVAVAGFPKEKVPPGAYCVNTVEDACRGAEVVVLPLPGTNVYGQIRAVYYMDALMLTEEAIQKIAPHAIVIIGSAQPFLQKWSEKYGFTLLEVIDNDELAILNSIPTAEGAMQIAMEETKITINGSQCCVIGLGRVGMTLARLLTAFGAKVTVVSKEKSELARAYEMGCERINFQDLGMVLSQMDIVFNTVPSLILTRTVLQQAHPDVLIIDLANQPGGTDFEAANSLGIKAILAPGLPGRVAPVSAGKILAEVIPRLIINTMEQLNMNLLFSSKEV